jgi:hypothetical protein
VNRAGSRERDILSGVSVSRQTQNLFYPTFIPSAFWVEGDDQNNGCCIRKFGLSLAHKR